MGLVCEKKLCVNTRWFEIVEELQGMRLDESNKFSSQFFKKFDYSLDSRQ